MDFIYFSIKKSAGERGCISMTQRSKISNRVELNSLEQYSDYED